MESLNGLLKSSIVSGHAAATSQMPIWLLQKAVKSPPPGKFGLLEVLPDIVASHKACNSAGKQPSNWLFWSSNIVSLLKLPSSEGMFPVNWLSRRSRFSKLTKFPNSFGIAPEKLPRRVRKVKFVKLPISLGILPC